jgi:signal transduction histidine kinase
VAIVAVSVFLGAAGLASFGDHKGAGAAFDAQTVGDQAPGDQAVAYEAPGDQAPGDQTVGDQAVAYEAPGDEAPGDQTVGDQAVAYEAPGDEAPGDQTVGDQTVDGAGGPDGRVGARDPAMLGVDRWLANWPGVAGVSTASWWAARVGAAGLLSSLALGAVHAPCRQWTAAGMVLVMALLATLPANCHIVRAALGLVAVTGLGVTVTGTIAWLGGRLTTRVLPSAPLLSMQPTVSGVMVQVATTAAVLCLAAACLTAVVPATSVSPGQQRKWQVWALVGTSVACWAFGVPALLRLSGPLSGDGPHAIGSALAVVLGPLGGGHAGALADWVLFAACSAGAMGAMSGGTVLMGAATSTAAPAHVGRHGLPAGCPGPGRPVLGTLPVSALVPAAIVTGLAGAGVALVGPRQWLVVALGALATGALALTALAPAWPYERPRVRPGGQMLLGTMWAVLVAIAVGSAGPAALTLVGLVGLVGPYTLARQSRSVDRHWLARRSVLPLSTATAALITIIAVVTLAALPAGPGGTAAWRWLAVVVMGAGIMVVAVLPATSRLRTEHLGRNASVLAGTALPALARMLEAWASGNASRWPTSELLQLRAATRPLETGLATCRTSDDMLELTKALVEASNQVLRVASGVEALARLDGRRLQELVEEIVEERTAALSHANRHLVDSQWRRRQLLDRTVRVAEGERARIAANLHDGPIQRLAALGLILDRCRLRLDRDDRTGARELVKRARTELSAEIHSLRQMMSELRPPILDEGGLEAALRDQLSAWTSSTGVESRFEAGAHAGLEANSETVIYRVVQEALANVAKHACATHVLVTLTQSGTGVQAVVRDNGRGFKALSQPDLLRGGHFGLVVMRERVELAAGRFDVQSAPLAGTEVTVWLPTGSTTEPEEVA